MTFYCQNKATCVDYRLSLFLLRDGCAERMSVHNHEGQLAVLPLSLVASPLKLPTNNTEFTCTAESCHCLESRRVKFLIFTKITCANAILPGQLKGHYKGFAGGIRCISCLSEQQMVASCGLDRFLRIHHLHNRKLLHKVLGKFYILSALFDIVERLSQFHRLKLMWWTAKPKPLSCACTKCTTLINSN